MNHARTRRYVGIGLTTLIVGLLSFAVAAPAQATHTTGLALEITPEVASVTIGATATTANVTAKLVDPVTGQEKAPPSQVLISFEILGGPADADGNTPESPDRSCTITPPATQCVPTAPIAAATAGSGLIRGWIEEDNQSPPTGFIEADLDEARLSDILKDCTTEASADAFRACQSGTADSGSTSERDNTDVVFVQFTTGAAKLDCQPEDGRARRTEDAKFTCTVLDTNDMPVAAQRLDAENLNGANDPDSATGGTADFDNACQTNEQGWCTITIPAAPGGGRNNQLGRADICVWVDTDNDSAFAPKDSASEPNPGTLNDPDGGACNESREATEKANTTDVVSVSWEERAATRLNAEPELPAPSTSGGTHTITLTITDQFGAAWEQNVMVKGELFGGSANDVDGDSPGTPDFACATNTGSDDETKSGCQVSYTGAEPGFDVICFWFGDAAPALAGTGSDATCDGESRGGTDVERVDVVAKSWTEPSATTTTTTTTTTSTTTTTTQPTTTTTTAPPRNDPAQGYSLVGEDGSLYAYGTARNVGDMKGRKLNAPIIGVAYTPGGNGYWLVARDGGIFTFGNANFYGSMGDKNLNSPVIGMAATPTGKGYWLFAGDGGIFTFGDARFFGSMGDQKLNQPVINMEPLESGNGYWLVAADGGIFTFGQAKFYGSMGDQKLNQPVFDMTSTDTDNGYWLVARDGGVFSFGDAGAKFYGNPVNETNPKPTRIIGMDSTPGSLGYWIADANGKVWNYGNAQALGDRFGANNPAPMIGFASVPGQKL